MISGILSFVLSSPIWANEMGEQNRDKQETVHQIGRVVVTADQGGTKGIAIEPGTTSIDLDTYRGPGHEETIQDILQGIAGVDIQRTTPALSDDRDAVKIRGFGGRRFMVRIDGRPIRNSGGFGDTLVDWTSLSLENVERIEVMRGAHSAVYGETIGGTINIVTKKGGTREDMKPEVVMDADYSSYDTQSYTARLTGNAKSLGYALAGGYRSSDGYLRNTDYEIRDFTGRLSYLFPFDGRLTVGYKISNQDKSLSVVNDPSRSDYDSSYPDIPVDAFGTPYYSGGKNFFDRETQYFDLIFEQPTPFGDWKIHLYKSKEDRDQVSYQFSRGVYYDYFWIHTFDDYGWIVQDSITLFDKHYLTFGYDVRKMYTEYQMISPFRNSESDRTKRIEHQAGYIEDSWQINEALNLTLGLRYDYADMDFTAFKGDIDEWSPKSRLTYEFMEDTKGFVYISKAFRVPTWMEYCWMGYPTGENLKNETAMEYEVGVSKELGNKNSIQLTYYYYDVDNYIVYNHALNPRAAEMAGRPIADSLFNADYLRLQGIEAELNFEIFERLGGYINYTYQDYDLGPMRVLEDEARIDVYQLPRHKANLGLEWDPWEDTTIMADIRYVDDRKTSLNEKIDGFVTMDLGLEQSFRNKKLRLKGYITNLFDKEYEEIYLIPAPERTFGINVSYTF
jgi:iron complex outermembrane receptor protein